MALQLAWLLPSLFSTSLLAFVTAQGLHWAGACARVGAGSYSMIAFWVRACLGIQLNVAFWAGLVAFRVRFMGRENAHLPSFLVLHCSPIPSRVTHAFREGQRPHSIRSSGVDVRSIPAYTILVQASQEYPASLPGALFRTPQFSFAYPDCLGQSLQIARVPMISGFFWLAGFTWIACSLVS